MMIPPYTSRRQAIRFGFNPAAVPITNQPTHNQPRTSFGSRRLVEPVRNRCRSWSPSTAAKHRVWCLTCRVAAPAYMMIGRARAERASSDPGDRAPFCKCIACVCRASEGIEWSASRGDGRVGQGAYACVSSKHTRRGERGPRGPSTRRKRRASESVCGEVRALF